MAAFEFGDIVLIDFPFTDRDESKRRPGFVLAAAAHSDLLIARISSKVAERETDVELTDWEIGGLNIPSIVRLLKLTTTNDQLVLRKLGTVSQRDREAVVNAFIDFAKSLK